MHPDGYRDGSRVNQPDWAEQVTRAAQVTGAPFTHSDPLLSYGVQLEDFARPEFAWLRRSGLYTGGGIAAAVAGQQGCLELRVTPSNRALVVVETIAIQATASGRAFVQLKAGIGGPYFGGELRDDRMLSGVNRPSMAQFSVFTNAAPGFTAQAFATTCGTPPNIFNFPCIITGNLALVVGIETPNIAATFGITWRERPLLPSEY